MWFLNRGLSKECLDVQDALDRAKGAGELTSPARDHLARCADCHLLAENLSEVRNVLATRQTGPQPGPFFLKRVMAAIAQREAELDHLSQTWAAVPRLASRLTVLASLGLLIAAGWLYEQPRRDTGTAVVISAQSPESPLEGASTAAPDEFLLSASDR